MEDLKSKDDGTLSSMMMTTKNNADSVEIALPDTTLFEPGTATLTKDSKVGLKRIAQSLMKVKGLVGIEISGHTDSSPPSANAKFSSNWALSSARAGAVAEELIKQGVDAERNVRPRAGKSSAAISRAA